MFNRQNASRPGPFWTQGASEEVGEVPVESFDGWDYFPTSPPLRTRASAALLVATCAVFAPPDTQVAPVAPATSPLLVRRVQPQRLHTTGPIESHDIAAQFVASPLLAVRKSLDALSHDSFSTFEPVDDGEDIAAQFFASPFFEKKKSVDSLSIDSLSTFEPVDDGEEIASRFVASSLFCAKKSIDSLSTFAPIDGQEFTAAFFSSTLYKSKRGIDSLTIDSLSTFEPIESDDGESTTPAISPLLTRKRNVSSFVAQSFDLPPDFVPGVASPLLFRRRMAWSSVAWPRPLPYENEPSFTDYETPLTIDELDDSALSFLDVEIPLTITDNPGTVEINTYITTLELDDMSYIIKEGALLPGISGKVTSATGVNLDDAVLTMRYVGTTVPTFTRDVVVVNDGEDPDNAGVWLWHYLWVGGDTDVPDKYHVEIFTDVDEKLIIFPNTKTATFRIEARLV